MDNSDSLLNSLLEQGQKMEDLKLNDDTEEGIAERLLALIECSSSLNEQITSLEVYKKMAEWVQHSGTIYSNDTSANAIFSEILTHKYFQKLQKYNVHFRHNDLNFNDMNLFHVITSEESYLLQVIKIYDAFKSNKLQVLCVRPEEVIDVQKQVIKAFELPHYMFLIIIWPKNKQESVITEMCDKLRIVLDNYDDKKVIIVSERDNELPRKIGLNCSVIEERVKFGDLSDDTQKNLLTKKNIVFQGTDVCLEELFGSQKTEDYNKVINSKIMEKCIRNEKIKVGSDVKPLDYNTQSYYIDRHLQRNVQYYVQSVEEDKIYEIKEKIVIIEGSARMGKTSFLTKLAVDIKKKYPHLWVMRINIDRYIRILKYLLAIQISDCKDTSIITNHLEKNVFSVNKKVVLVLDGLNESNSDYISFVIDLLTKCRDSSNILKVFVGVTSCSCRQFEVNLQVRPFRLQPLTKQEQKDFVISYWERNLKISGDTNKKKCEKYAETLINSISWHMHREPAYEIIDPTPQHVWMLAEVFQENNSSNVSKDWIGFKEYLKADVTEPELPEVISIRRLYEMFIKKRIEKLCKVDTVTIQVLEQCLDAHRSLALTELFDKSKCELFSCYKNGLTNIEENILKLGIVQQVDNEYHFVDKIFAEYFASESLYREIQLRNENIEFQRLFFEEVIYGYRNYNIHAFLDKFLEKEIDSLPCDIVQNYQKCTTTTYKGYPCFLMHNLADYLSLLKLFIKCLKFQMIVDKETKTRKYHNIFHFFIINDGINISDERNQTVLLHIARKGYLDVVEFLVKEGADVNIMSIPGETALDCAVRGGHFSVVKFLVEHGANRGANIKMRNLYWYSIYNSSVDIVEYFLDKILQREDIDTKHPETLYVLAYLGRLDTLKDLTEHGLDVNTTTIRNDETLLFGAARGGQLETIKYLALRGADINAKDSNGYTALRIIANDSSLLSTAKLLVELGVDINAGDCDGNTALHCAARDGNLEMVEFLVESGAEVNSQNTKFGETALYLASLQGRRSIVSYLIKAGADPNIEKLSGLTALQQVISYGNYEVAKILIEGGADVNAMSNERKSTPLQIAASAGMVNTIDILVKHGADVNVRDGCGRTTLHIAASNGHVELMEYLVVQCNLDVNSVDDSNRTALHLAALEGRIDAVVFLVRQGTSVDVQDSEGFTPLHLATLVTPSDRYRFYHENYTNEPIAKVYLSVIKFLVGQGADLNTKDNLGRTVLHSHASKGYLELIKYFIQQCDIDVNSIDDAGRTALHLAASEGCLDIVVFLVEQGASVNVQDGKGFTPLHLAALGTPSDKTRFHNRGCSPIEAMTKTYLSVVKFLVEQDADIRLRNSVGDTPAILAKRKKHWHVLKYLESLESLKN